jgi:hypothetical protein
VDPFVGRWAYRSLKNDPSLQTDFAKLKFGAGTLDITSPGFGELAGTIGGDDWQLELRGSISYGTPMQIRFQGKGIVSGREWIYDYIGWLVPVWPNSTSVLQRSAIVGSVVRTIPHPSDDGGVSPAGVVASFYAVRQD